VLSVGNAEWHSCKRSGAGSLAELTVPRYSAFGFTLESAVDLPELATSSRSPDWWITRERGQAPEIPATFLGAETVYDGVMVRSYSSGDALRLEFDDTGTFDVRPAARLIAWYPGSNTSETAIRADLLGRVVAFAAHADGHMTLHASAVSINGRAIAFLGPKHAGKSTLALALVREGARLLTDDPCWSFARGEPPRGRNQACSAFDCGRIRRGRSAPAFPGKSARSPPSTA
jgi:hypothetical protein